MAILTTEGFRWYPLWEALQGASVVLLLDPGSEYSTLTGSLATSLMTKNIFKNKRIYGIMQRKIIGHKLTWFLKSHSNKRKNKNKSRNRNMNRKTIMKRLKNRQKNKMWIQVRTLNSH